MNETGHMLVARIAWDRMTPQARKTVEQLTADPNNPGTGTPTSPQDDDVFTAATWMDDIRPVDSKFHFVNTPLNGNGDFPTDENAVTFAQSNIAVLKDAHASKDEKAEALRFVLHLMGDLHQPLHCSDNGDRGGNQFPIQAGRAKNLHAFWDSGGGAWNAIKRPLSPQSQELLTRMASDLEHKYPVEKYQVQAQDVDPAHLAHEGWELARQDCYNGIQRGERPSQEYTARVVDDMGREAALGGYRLANLLNGIFTEPPAGAR